MLAIGYLQGGEMKSILLVISLIFSSHVLAQSYEIVQPKFIFDDREEFNREPFGLLFEHARSDFAEKFGGPIRVSIAISSYSVFPVFVPVFADGSLDYIRVKQMRQTARSASSWFAEENKVEFDEESGLIRARIDGRDPVIIGQTLEDGRIYFCTGEFLGVCSLELIPVESEYAPVDFFVRIVGPTDWSDLEIVDPSHRHIEECPGFNSSDLPVIPEIQNPLGEVTISVGAAIGHGSTCEEIKAEMQLAADYWAQHGVRIEFIFGGESTGQFHWMLFLQSRIMPVEAEGWYTATFGIALLESQTIVLGQPTYGHRPKITLAHEIGHMFLGEEHVDDFEEPKNIMVANPRVRLETFELNEAQKQKLIDFFN
jgi:hypothetical protein